jgi:WD40 repeat protein
MSRVLRAILFCVYFLIEAAQAQQSFPKAIQLVFERNCVGCHNHAFLDKVDVSGGLALDSFDRVIGRKRPVIVPGNASASELVRRLESSDAQVRMPKGGERLPPEAIEAVRNWIDSGAKGENSTQVATASVPESSPPISIKPSEVFVPYGGRDAIEAGYPLKKRQATAPVVPLPGVLIVEEDPDKAPNRVVEPYTKGLIGKIGPLPAVTALAFSPQGKSLLVGFYGRVVVWDLVESRIVQELNDVAGSVNDLQFSPDGKLLSVVGGKPFSQGEIRLYDPSAQLRLVSSFAAHKETILAQTFSPDSQRLATAGLDKVVEIRDVGTGRTIAEMKDHSDTVQCLAFSPKGDLLATAGMDRTIKISDGMTAKGKMTINPEIKGFLALTFSPDGKYVLTSGESPEVRWWELATVADDLTEGGWRPTRKMEGHVGTVQAMRFSPDGRLLATASADHSVCLWDGESGHLIRTLVDCDNLVYAVAFSPDSKLLAAGSWDGFVRIWDVSSGRLRITLVQKPLSRDGRSEWLAVSPEGRLDGSPELRKLVRARGNGSVEKVHHTPGLLAESLQVRR